MANTKNETLKKETPVENVQDQQDQNVQDPQTQKAPEVEEKAYKFVSSNKYLTVSSLGVQFVNGKATVTDLTVARALATIDGVTLVED